MPTSESLVPVGLPYGSRQQVREGMRSAGLPLNPPSGGGVPAGGQAPRPDASSASGRGPVLDPVALLQASTPDQFAFLADPPAASPAVEPAAPGSLSDALAGSAQSSFARAVSERLAQNQQRRP